MCTYVHVCVVACMVLKVNSVQQTSTLPQAHIPQPSYTAECIKSVIGLQHTCILHMCISSSMHVYACEACGVNMQYLPVAFYLTF